MKSTELQTQFYKEKGIEAFNSQGEPDIDYIRWLEEREVGSDERFYSNMCTALLFALILSFVIYKIELDNREAIISLQNKKRQSADSCYNVMKDSVERISEEYLIIKKNSRLGQKLNES